jgi:internalin A
MDIDAAPISLESLDQVLERAHAEGWRELALIHRPLLPRASGNWISKEHTFFLREPLGDRINKLASLRLLTSLELSGHQFGDEGAQAVSSLSLLSSLSLRTNAIGRDGAATLATLGGLTRLDISDNEITPQGMTSLAHLSNLRFLNVNNCSLRAEGAKALESLRKLEYLDAGANFIEDEGVRALANLTKLKFLSLNSGFIRGSGLKDLEALDSLHTLDLSDNSLEDEYESCIASFKRLVRLDLAHCRVRRLDRILPPLKELKELDLTSSFSGNDNCYVIGEIRGLVSLSCGSNYIDISGAALLSQCNALEELSLENNHVGNAGVVYLSRLHALTKLNLRANGISAAGARLLSSLKKLQKLDISLNPIGPEGAASFVNLPDLTSLNLEGCAIGDRGAREVSKLNFLTELGLTNNGITDVGASSLAALHMLNSLRLNANMIGDVGAQELAKLTALSSVHLASNRIGIEGGKSLLESWSLYSSARLIDLQLHANEAMTGLLPAEILQIQDAQAVLAAFRRYSVERERGSLTTLDEAKLVVVGNEAVGKTSLIRYLVHGAPLDPHEKKTTGTVIRERIDVEAWSLEQVSIRVNVWDFGGQEIMRGTHRFFLTARSLYVLVLEERREDDRSIYEWLPIIRAYGDGSPIIVVVNKSDEGIPRLQLDERILRSEYPEIVDFLRTSCTGTAESALSIQRLRRLVCQTLLTSERLRSVREPVPRSWVRIKNELVRHAKEKRILSSTDYISLCQGESHGKPRESVIGDDEQRVLLRLLHDLGIVVAHGLRRAEASISQIHILDPNWLTESVYALLMSETALRQHGELQADQIEELLPDHTAQSREYIIDMMMDRDIGLSLCFQLVGTSPARYLLPAALPRQEPYYGNWPPSLQFRFRYSNLPEGLIPRLIVESHEYLTDPRTWWRTGVVLRIDGCDVLVRGDLGKKCVDVKVSGRVGQRAALAVVRAFFQRVHKSYVEICPEERVPLPDNPELDVGYGYLIDQQKLYGLQRRFHPERAHREYGVGELLEGVENESRPVRLSEREARKGFGEDNGDRSIGHRFNIQATGNSIVNIVDSPLTSGLFPEKTMTAEGVVSSTTDLRKPRWWLVASISSLSVMILAVAIYLLPSSWRMIVSGLASIGIVTFLLVMQYNPQYFYRRWLARVIGIGFAAHFAGTAFDFFLYGDKAAGSVRWDGRTSTVFYVSWAAIVVALVIADIRIQTSKPLRP